MDVKVETERLKVEADALAGKVKELIHEGNVRRIIIKNDQGQTVMEIPVTFGVVGAIAAPVVAAIGAIAALAARWTIVVERKEPPAEASPKQIEATTPEA